MDQFRLIGGAVGSLNALMVFRNDIKINPRQCDLLFDSFRFAFDSVSQAIKAHLHFDQEKQSKWKPIENPLKELYRIMKQGENYINNCMDSVNWQGKAIALNGNNDCVEVHLHNLLWCVALVLEAIQETGKVSKKYYDRELIDPGLFRCMFGRDYLVSEELCRRMENAVKEDYWLMSESFKAIAKQEDRISELFLSPKSKIHLPSVLLCPPDYQVKKRLEGNRTNCKEIQWMGERFAMKHAIGEEKVENLMQEFSLHSSLVHPSVMSYMYSFCDNADRKEGYVLMELMSKDLASCIKEKRTLLVIVDVMLQVARGMEYLHSKNIYHGDLNPSNVLVKANNSSSSPENYLSVKVANFGRSTNSEAEQSIWYAPEVLSSSTNCKYTEKADVYSFAMISFELLTGKAPFEESHLQGEKMSRNIIAGERPLFPYNSAKCLVNLTKKCWHSDPAQRPSFSCICRILRYIKRSLILNSGIGGQPEVPNLFDVEMSLSKRVMNWGSKECVKVSNIPFEMYGYKVMEKDTSKGNFVKDKCSDSGSEGASICGEENGLNGHVSSTESLSSSGCSESSSNGNRKDSLAKKVDGKAGNKTGQQQKAQKALTAKSPELVSYARSRMSPARRTFKHV